jgi:hypothetical protein
MEGQLEVRRWGSGGNAFGGARFRCERPHLSGSRSFYAGQTPRVHPGACLVLLRMASACG